MRYRLITKILLALSVIILIAWDVVAYIFGENATISVVITDFSFYTPWIPFAFGVLMGHLFFPPKRSIDD
jgi:hypothetical protein